MKCSVFTCCMALLWSTLAWAAQGSGYSTTGLDRLIAEEVELLDVLEGTGSSDKRIANILRDGYWPSENARKALKLIVESRQHHGVDFAGIALEPAVDAYEAVRDAQRAIKLARQSPSSDVDILVGLAVGALSRARAVEDTVAEASRVLMLRTTIRGENKSSRAVRKKLLRFLRSPSVKGLFPEHPEYLGLLEGLNRFRALGTAEEWAVMTMEERFRALGWGDANDQWALRRFQTVHQLPETGVMDSETREILAFSQGTLQGRIQDSLRRWHQSPLRGKKTFYRVNIPAFAAEFWLDGESYERYRVVVGDRAGETPEFARSITSIVLNPAWYVPDSVRQRDLKKRQQKDPDFYKDNGFRKIANGRKLVQKPGPGNWLGRVIFRWDRGGTQNVFVHDSPFQERFEQPRRAMSHGCINMENALSFAQELALRFSGMAKGRFERKLDSGKTRKIKLKKPLAAFLEYVTVIPGPEKGQLVFLPDVYERLELEKGELAQQW